MNRKQFPGNYSHKQPVSRLLPTVCLAAILSVMAASTAIAFTSYTNSFNAEYGTAGTSGGSTLGSCITCHVNSNGTGGINSYGTDWAGAGRNYLAVEGFDSDGDGYTNIKEIVADTFPGNASSKPTPVNDPPVADAGPDQNVNEGASVILDGSGSSDPDGVIASYMWKQTDGIGVTLSKPSALRPIFKAPEVGPDGAVLTFQITVMDVEGLQSTDSCVVQVNASDSTGDDEIPTGEIQQRLHTIRKVLMTMAEDDDYSHWARSLSWRSAKKLFRATKKLDNGLLEEASEKIEIAVEKLTKAATLEKRNPGIKATCEGIIHDLEMINAEIRTGGNNPPLDTNDDDDDDDHDDDD